MGIAEVSVDPCTDAQLTNKVFSTLLKEDVCTIEHENREENKMLVKLGLILNLNYQQK